jgi:hypothetical protein
VVFLRLAHDTRANLPPAAACPHRDPVIAGLGPSGRGEFDVEMIHGRPASSRTGYLSVLLPASTPEHRIRSLVPQMVVDALAAADEWPTRVKIVSSQRANDGPMTRWFAEYETGPHARLPTRPTSSTNAARSVSVRASRPQTRHQLTLSIVAGWVSGTRDVPSRPTSLT